MFESVSSHLDSMEYQNLTWSQYLSNLNKLGTGFLFSGFWLDSQKPENVR